MNNNPKVKYSKEDLEKHLITMYIQMIVERDHRDIIVLAEKMAKQFIEDNQDKVVDK